MTYRAEPISVLVSVCRATATLLSFVLLTATPRVVLAHGGHGNEFQGDEQSLPTAGSIQVDVETAQRMGLQVESVTQRQLTVRLKATGQIEILPNQQVEVTTPVGGTITRLFVSPGEQVKLGQVVALMSSPELAGLRTEALDRQAEAITSVQQAQTDLQLAQQTYRQQVLIVAQEIAQAQTVLRFAQEKYDKDQELLMRGAIPRRTFLESETQLAEAKANLSKAESRLPVAEAKAQIQRSQSALQAAQLKIQLSQRTYRTRLKQLGSAPNSDGTIAITAPISGTVTDSEVTPGESGQDAGKKVMTIANGRRVQISANIYEKDLQQIKLGQQIQVKVNSLPDRTFEGRVSIVGSVVDQQTRVVPIKAELGNADAVLRPGMFAELEVLTNGATEAVLASPRSAIVETNDKKTIVFVQNGNAFQQTEVTLGQTSGDFVEIKDGLFEGDQVVTQRATQLYAQTLRGGGKAEEAKVEHAPRSEVRQTKSILTKLNLQILPLPEWVVVPSVGAIAAGTFWLGRRSAKPKTLNVCELNDSEVADDGFPSTKQDNFSADADPAEDHTLDVESKV